MLPRKVVTKKQKKEKIRKKLAAVLVLFGLIIASVSLFYTVFFKTDPLYISPLSKDQSPGISKIEKILKEKKIHYESLSVSEDLTYKVKLDQKSEVIIDPKKDAYEQLSSLQLILSQLKIEGKAFKRLDFRYQKPIISF